MDILKCILKIYPDWRGVVRENDYEKIQPHKLEDRPIPSLIELQAVWPQVQEEVTAKAITDQANKNLIAIDLKSIRSISEWVAAQPTCPQNVIDCEVLAQVELAKLKRP